MAHTQRITMAGRTYTFVHAPQPAGEARQCVGYLLNSRHQQAGYVHVMASGTRLLLGGPAGISRDAEREGLAQIDLTEDGRTRDQIRADWCRQARSVVTTSDGLTGTERTTLNDAAEILKGRPDLLAEWIEAATAEGAILGPSKDAVRA